MNSTASNSLRSGFAGSVFAGTIFLAACGGSGSPQATADATTKAIYNDDVTAMQARFDDDLRKQVTLDQVATISSKLHALGAYDGLSQTSADTAAGRFDYNARFGAVTVPVHIRFDASGKLAAYRLDIPDPVATTQ